MSDQRDTSTKEELSPSDSTAEETQSDAAATDTRDAAAAQDDGTSEAAAAAATSDDTGDTPETTEAEEPTEVAASDETVTEASSDEAPEASADDAATDAPAAAGDDAERDEDVAAETSDTEVAEAVDVEAETTEVDDAESDDTVATESADSSTDEAPVAAEASDADEAPAAAEAAAEETGPAEAPAVETPIAAEASAADEAPAAEEPGTQVADAEQAEGAATDVSRPADAVASETRDGDSSTGETAAASDGAEGDQNPADIAKANPALEPLIKAHEEKTPVEGTVIGWNKGGFHVAIGSIAAFCPVSQIELGNPRSPKRYIDKPFTFMVIEIEKGGRRIVLSRAAALKAAREAKSAMVKDTVKTGAEMTGRVTSLTDFGAFVKLMDGVEGLVHISEISRRRVEHPKDVLEVGKEVKVQILKVEKRGERISLSMKRLEADPWKNVAERFPVADPFKGVIRRKTEFGLFVEVEPGLEGLIHTSRLPLGKNMEDETLAVGNEVEGWVHEVEAKRRRLALSLREVPKEQPWRNVEDRFPIGNVFKGIVERVAEFGAFIQLEPGLTGLLPFSELNLGGGANPKRQYHAGKEVSVRVLSIDQDRKRISLGTESSKAVGTTADYKAYINKQKQASSGLSAMAAAFAKLKQP